MTQLREDDLRSYFGDKMMWDYRHPERRRRERSIDMNHYPGWARVECHCCGGIEWSSEPPGAECRTCEGMAGFAVHLATGTVALWPGGPLRGERVKNQ